MQAQSPEDSSAVTAAITGQKPSIFDSLSGRAGFLCLLGAYFLVRLPWIFTIPMQEAPDEFAHYWVIKFLRENWRLPHAAEVFAGGPSAVYGSMPQLGYIPHILTSFCMPLEELALSERFGSLMMGGVMLGAAYQIAQLLFPRNRLAAMAIPTAIVLHPQLVFLHSYANNDSTSSGIASVLIWLALQTVASGIDFKRIQIMGALVGWVAITKYSGLAIIPVMGIAVISAVLIHGSSFVQAGLAIAGAGLIAALISMWWFIQNGQEYPGDPMGTKTMYKSWASTFHRDLNYYLPVSHIIKSLRWWRMMFFSFWGMFGYMNKYLWRPVYIAYFVILLASVLGGLNGLRLSFSSLKSFRLNRENAKPIVMWSCLLLTVLINLASIIWASVYNLGGPQGRYLFTSEIPVMALLVGGMNLLGRRVGKVVIISFLLLNLSVTIGSWIYLFNLYGGWRISPL